MSKTENTYKPLHIPIMVDEIISYFDLKPDSIIIDATCGEGGHSCKFAKLIPNGLLICIDRNADILLNAKKRLSEFSNVKFINTTFDRLPEALKEVGIKKADAILADLGISMFHLKTEGLGFSYNDEISLDMRLDHTGKFSAYDVVNKFKEFEIADIIYKYGEEHDSRKIARAIVKSRPINSSKDLSEIIRKTLFYRKGRIHPATKTFQALRIFINDELKKIESFIPIAVDKLNTGGKLAMISFHSMEDRIVKFGFQDLKKEGKGIILTKKPITASENEMRDNPASRSAKLRVIEKK